MTDSALDALIRRSGLHYLQARHTLTPELQTVYDGSKTTFNESLQRIRHRGDDECIDAIAVELASLANLVDNETAVNGTPGDFADTVLNTTMATESEVVNTVLALPLCTVQWTHNIETAIVMVSSQGRA